MTDAQYNRIKERAAALLPSAAASLGLAAAGLQIVVDEMAFDRPELIDGAIPPTVRMSEADYRDLIRRLRLEP